MVLLIDNFDSFSHMLADYLRQIGMDLYIVRNDVDPSLLMDRDWEALILSPGPETPEKAGNLMAILDLFVGKLPVLGICLGHQAIGQYFGANLVKGRQPVHGKVHLVFQKNAHPYFQGIPENFKVTRYHSLELRDLPQELEILLETEAGEIMAIAHRNLPILGLQFHPEAYLTEYGKELLENWWGYCQSEAFKALSLSIW
ncbi:anthranilate synthase component II [Cecembia calidifontis]|jgi:anthranilate synthase component 2|uniref:Anthranilate synthase component 2 n=1 Tax=Cecembia calidifontis TaxID=1187080 RepID=A0A4Q7P8S9_9BACT|nr:aminodeoxychorismate/anthranilate synthase component II [Cecembia calidifontis]RZS95968.1 anthranilate synthase component 2 [Cecembia calidifontis]